MLARPSVCIGKKPNVVIPLLQRTYKTNQERGNRGDAERSVVSASVLSISAKWTKELNKRDETVMRSSAHQKRGPATTQILNYLTTTKQRIVIEQKNLKATLMRRAPDNMRRAQESVCCSTTFVQIAKLLRSLRRENVLGRSSCAKQLPAWQAARQFGRGELDQSHRVDALVSCWILQLLFTHPSTNSNMSPAFAVQVCCGFSEVHLRLCRNFSWFHTKESLHIHHLSAKPSQL